MDVLIFLYILMPSREKSLLQMHACIWGRLENKSHVLRYVNGQICLSDVPCFSFTRLVAIVVHSLSFMPKHFKITEREDHLKVQEKALEM